MTLIIIGLGLSFLASLAVSVHKRRDVLTRKSGIGCILATLIACAGLTIFLKNPTVQDTQWITQASTDRSQEPQNSLRSRLLSRPQNHAPRPEPVAQTLQPQPVKIVDAYSASSNAIVETTTDHQADIQSHLLNNQFRAALKSYVALVGENGTPPEGRRDRWEAQALRQIRPIPASEKAKNLYGYLFLSALKPDEPSYLAKIDRYSR